MVQHVSVATTLLLESLVLKITLQMSAKEAKDQLQAN